MINYFYLQTICTKIRGDFVFLQVSVEKHNGTSNKYNCVIDWTREITENIGKTIPKQIAVLLLVIWNRVLPAQVTHWILKVLTCDSDKMDGPLCFFLQDLGRIFGSCPTPDSERSLPFWKIFFINILHCSPRNYSQHLRVLSVKLKVCALYCELSLYLVK